MFTQPLRFWFIYTSYTTNSTGEANVLTNIQNLELNPELFWGAITNERAFSTIFTPLWSCFISHRQLIVKTPFCWRRHCKETSKGPWTPSSNTFFPSRGVEAGKQKITIALISYITSNWYRENTGEKRNQRHSYVYSTFSPFPHTHPAMKNEQFWVPR